MSQVSDFMAQADSGSRNDQVAKVEILRRQTVFQEKTMLAQEKASKATEDTAKYTMQNANYMRGSVIAIAITSGIQAIVALVAYFYPSH